MKQRLIYIIGVVLLLLSPVISQAQINYQYWIDDNKDAAVSGTTTDGTSFSLSIDAAGLTTGVHFLNMRAREGQKWGTVYRKLFVIPRSTDASGTEMKGYEYWIDNDYANRVSANASGSSQTAVFTVDAGNLSSGVHFFNMRVQDANGQWGTVKRQLFCIPREQQADVDKLITGYRYGFGNEMTMVTFDTPVSEYTLNQMFDVPAAPPPTTIDDDCHFSFSGATATLMRNMEMTFTLTFTDQANAMSAPVGTSFTVTDTQTSDIVEMTVPSSQTITAHSTGGYTVVSFTIPSAEEYVLTSTAAASLRLFSSEGATLTTVDSENLVAGYTQAYEVGTYYAVVYGNADEITLSVAPLADRPSVGYAILDTETGTLTFKYGPMPDGDNVWETENTDFADYSSSLWLSEAPWVSENLTKVVFDPSYAEARPLSTAFWFNRAANLTEIIGLEYLNTSQVTNMEFMFSYCRSLTSLDLSHFDTSNVTNMRWMFRQYSLTSIDVSHFDTSNVTDMYMMFYQCRNLASLDLSNFDTSKVTDMSEMFYECNSLTSLDISSFNTSNVTNMARMFVNCYSLASINVSHFVTSKVTDMAGMFASCSSLTSLDVTHFDTSNVLSFSGMFASCSSLTSLDVTNFDTSKATNMRAMFSLCNALTTLDLSSFDTSNVTDMWYMFEGCSGLTTLDLSNFDTSNVTKMESMFKGCSGLTILDLSNFDTQNVTSMWGMFDGCSSLTSLNLSSLNTSNVTDMQEMFEGCSSLTSLDLSSFNTGKTNNMRMMFKDCNSLKTIYVGEGWSTGAVTAYGGYLLFEGCTTLVGGRGTVYNASHVDKTYARIDGGTSAPGYLTPKGGYTELCGYAIYDSSTGTLTFKYGVMPTGDNVWETENTVNSSWQIPWYSYSPNILKVVFDASYAEVRPTSTACWFNNASKLTQIEGLQYLNTCNVTNMVGMFQDCSGLTSLDVSHFDTSNVTNMGGMFLGCSGLTSLDVSHFDTSNVTNMVGMFQDCSGLTSLDVSHFDTSNVTGMDGMFLRCSGLTSLDVSHFDTGNVTSMGSMFSGCSSLTSLNVSDFNTAKVKYMYCMFLGCSGLTSLDVSNFNTSNVTDMHLMFLGCSGLTGLDVSNFNTSNVTNMGGMFYGCSKLASLDVSHFDTSKADHIGAYFYEDGYVNGGMFQGCSSLTSLDLSSFNTSNVESMGLLFRGCSKLKTIYVSEGWTTDAVTCDDYMFTGCTALVGGKGTVYNASHVDKEYARIDGGPSAPGYFTEKFILGDANGDGSVTMADAVAVVNYILGNASASFIFGAADVNNDGKITITDAVTIVNMSLDN